MPLVKPRPVGYQPPPQPHRLPSSHPSSFAVIIAAVRRRLADGPVGRFVRYAYERNYYIVGSNGPACEFAPTATLSNAHINATSGIVTIGEHAMLAAGVTLIAGTHDMTQIDAARKTAIPHSGYDITIARGVFVGANATIVGPCRIGERSVIAAGAVVTEDIPAGVLAGGVPARVIKRLELATVDSGA